MQARRRAADADDRRRQRLPVGPHDGVGRRHGAGVRAGQRLSDGGRAPLRGHAVGDRRRAVGAVRGRALSPPHRRQGDRRGGAPRARGGGRARRRDGAGVGVVRALRRSRRAAAAPAGGEAEAVDPVGAEDRGARVGAVEAAGADGRAAGDGRAREGQGGVAVERRLPAWVPAALGGAGVGPRRRHRGRVADASQAAGAAVGAADATRALAVLALSSAATPTISGARASSSGACPSSCTTDSRRRWCRPSGS